MTLAADTEYAASDQALVERARAGVRGAFDTLVGRHERRIYRLAIRMSHNAADAEEITQEAFLHALRHLGAFEGGSRFGTWLYRIAVNVALMRRRAACRRPTDSLDELLRARGDGAYGRPVLPAPAVDELLDEKALAEAVWGALAELDDSQRAALVLHDLEGLSSEEAAKLLGLSPAAVRQRAHRARMKLRLRLAPLLRG
jgi:RNA polymerase sigma-70 factor (ECF subfamily)